MTARPRLHPLPAAAPSIESWEAADFIRVVLEKLWLIVLGGIAGFFVVWGYLAHLAPVYEATGSLQVQPPSAQPSVRGAIEDESDLSTVEAMNTLVENLQRPAFFLEVANDPALQSDLTLFPPRSDGVAYTDEQKIKAIASGVHVALQKGTLLIFVGATYTQPATAQRVCQAVLDNFVKDRLESRSGSEQETYRFFLSEADRLGGVLADEERKVQKYEQLGRYNDQIVAERSLIEQLSQRYKEKYPAMIEARALLRSLQDSFDAEMLRLVKADRDAGLKPAVTIDPAVGITDETRAQMIGQYQVLMRDIDTQRALFQSLTAQKNQSDVMRSAQGETAVHVADAPVLPETPVAQNPMRALAGGTILGLLVGVGLAFLLNAMDRSLQTVDQAESFLGLPVLSAVPELAAKKARGAGPESASTASLPMFYDANSPVAESIRSLRAAMALLGPEDERRSVILTSALPGEGKSFTAANYAIALANQGLQTLLIDADLRRPTLHGLFGGDRKSPGLVDYLLGRDPLEHYLLDSSIDGLSLMLSGTRAPNPAELLCGDGFARLMEEAGEKFDRVVVDTAPINAVSDTLMLLGTVQSVCLVVHAGSSPREAVLRAVRVLDQAGRKPVGAVFNRVPRRADLGYHRMYYYHYGTSGRYGDAYAETEA